MANNFEIGQRSLKYARSPWVPTGIHPGVSRLYRAVGSGFGVLRGLLQRSQGDQLLVNVQALNVDCALSFKGREGNEG